MKNQERWTFAQLYSSKELIKLGSVLVTCSSLNLVATFSNETNLTIGLSLLILIVILLFIRVESAIKQKFN
ncbi:SdpI family protein [Flavobacterium faecale]|nr:SdpI family protein [Flavobacterium faecale]